MFERLLEKILLARIGKYIVGLDKEQLKVAVWQGDIILENVQLNPELFQMWQLPLVLDFNTISRLIIKIPWTKLASEPVEILLEGLYMIISPQPKENWDFSEPGNIAKRKEYIEMHEARIVTHETPSAEDDLQNKSFIEKLTSKVLDNLKVKIRDIHVRFEYHLDDSHFSTGVTLQKIDCFTTNSFWEKEFTDRSQNYGIFKLITIEALHVYWKCDDRSIIRIDEVQKMMHDQIYLENALDSILAPSKVYVVTAQMRLIHNPDLQNNSPKYSIELILPTILVRYEKAQFHDTVRLTEYFTDYNKFLLKM